MIDNCEYKPIIKPDMPTHSSIAFRDKSFDLLKAIAIFLVIWQHCIFVMGYGMDMLNTYEGRAICMLNMPLFMFIVGYFSKSSVTISLKDMLKKKYVSLFLPMLIYCIILTVMDIVVTFNVSSVSDLLVGGGRLLLHNVICSYWFIWALMYLILYYRIINLSLKRLRLLWVSVISFILIMVLPRSMPIPHFMLAQSMYPFFLIGLIFREYNIIRKLGTCRFKIIIICSCVFAFALLYMQYEQDKFFYYFILIPTCKWLISYVMMFVAGLSGIILLILIARQIFESFSCNKILNYIVKVGQYTLSIYLMQGVLCRIVEYMNIGRKYWWSYLLIAVTIFILLGTISLYFAKFKITSKYLLGKE